MKTIGICEGCQEEYVKPAVNQRFCSKSCKDRYKINESTKKWLVKKPRKAKPGLSTKLDRMAEYGNWRKMLRKREDP